MAAQRQLGRDGGGRHIFGDNGADLWSRLLIWPSASSLPSHQSAMMVIVPRVTNGPSGPENFPTLPHLSRALFRNGGVPVSSRLLLQLFVVVTRGCFGGPPKASKLVLEFQSLSA